MWLSCTHEAVVSRLSSLVQSLSLYDWLVVAFVTCISLWRFLDVVWEHGSSIRCSRGATVDFRIWGLMLAFQFSFGNAEQAAGAAGEL